MLQLSTNALNYEWSTDKNGADSLSFHFNPCTRTPATWKEEIYAAARSVANRTKKPIWVCSSGGIDSEVACRAFYDQGIHFSVLTLEHEVGTNSHDIQYAIRWCRARDVSQKIVHLDMPLFLTSEVDAYSERYVAIHPFRYFQIKLMELVEEMGGYAVLAGGEQVYNVDPEKPHITRDDMYLLFAVGNIAPLEWCKDNKTAHEPYFYFSTPELCLSYMRLPLVSFTLNNPEVIFRHKSNAYTLKRLVYQSIWTDLEIRYKSDGFEKIKPLVQDAIERLRQKFGPKLLTYRLPVTMFEQQLSGALAVGDHALS